MRAEAYAKAVDTSYRLRHRAESVVERAAQKIAGELACPVCKHKTLEFDYTNHNYRGNTGILSYFNCTTCKRLILLEQPYKGQVSLIEGNP